MVNLVQGVPKAKVTARTPNAEAQAKAMEQILGYYADMDHLAENESMIVQQALIYGLSPARSCWFYREEEQTQLMPAIDPESGAKVWSPKTRRVRDGGQAVDGAVGRLFDLVGPTRPECGHRELHRVAVVDDEGRAQLAPVR